MIEIVVTLFLLGVGVYLSLGLGKFMLKIARDLWESIDKEAITNIVLGLCALTLLVAVIISFINMSITTFIVMVVMVALPLISFRDNRGN